MGEFDLIERIRSRALDAEGVVVGIGDDAAVLAPTPGHELVATTDSLVVDRHFTAEWPAVDVGHLAAQANLSDLAAMGARPRWTLLALILPRLDEDWVEGFLDGFLDALEGVDAVLVGGNLARGPLNIGVQFLGEVPAGQAVTRAGARSGDRLVVTGTLGEAAAALAFGEAASSALRERLRRPIARVRAGVVLRAEARAMIDISDGLLADLAHLLVEGQGAELDLDALPASAALLEAVPDVVARWRLQTGGGSDYELLAVLPPAADPVALSTACAVNITEIGRITETGRIDCRSAVRGVPKDLGRGWDHFGDE